MSMLTPTVKRRLPVPLQRRWWAAAALAALSLFAGYVFLADITDIDYAKRWLWLAAATLGLILWLLRRYLPLNHAPQAAQLWPGLGPGNWLTVGRGLLMGLMAGFVGLPLPPGGLGWLPAFLYTSAAFIDLFDGYAARRSGQTSRLGEILDVEFDALGVLLAATLVVWYGKLPGWFLLLAAFRYFYMLGLNWRARRGLPIAPLPDSVFRRRVAGIFMSFLTVLLWPIVYPPGVYVAAAVFCLPYVAVFLRDWLVSSRVIDPAAAAYRRRWAQPAHLLQAWLPPALRLGLALFLVLNLVAGARPAWGSFLQTAFDWTPATLLLSALNGATLIAFLLVCLGVLPHFTALWLILAAAADILGAALTLPNGLLLAAACALALLGGGRLALWQPEHDGIYHHRMGEEEGGREKEEGRRKKGDHE